MSLINDALKQAKETQPKQTTADGPALRPSEPLPPRKGGAAVPVVITAMVLLSGFFLWEWHQGKGGREVREAKPKPMAKPTATVQPKAVTPAVESKAEPVVVKAAPPPVAPPIVAKPAPAVEPAPAPAAPEAMASPSSPAASYKLQLIFYNPKNPTAVINGESVSIGSRLGDDQVIAIGKSSVTLRNRNGQTNLVELP